MKCTILYSEFSVQPLQRAYNWAIFSYHWSDGWLENKCCLNTLIKWISCRAYFLGSTICFWWLPNMELTKTILFSKLEGIALFSPFEVELRSYSLCCIIGFMMHTQLDNLISTVAKTLAWQGKLKTPHSLRVVSAALLIRCTKNQFHVPIII